MALDFNELVQRIGFQQAASVPSSQNKPAQSSLQDSVGAFTRYYARNNGMGDLLGALANNAGAWTNSMDGAIRNIWSMSDRNPRIPKEDSKSPGQSSTPQSSATLAPGPTPTPGTTPGPAPTPAPGPISSGKRGTVDAIRNVWGPNTPWNDPGLRAVLAISLAESGWDPKAGVSNDVEDSYGPFQTNLRAHGNTAAYWQDPVNSANKWVPVLKAKAAELQARGVDVSTPEGLWSLYGSVINPGVQSFTNPRQSVQWRNVMSSRDALDQSLRSVLGAP